MTLKAVMKTLAIKTKLYSMCDTYNLDETSLFFRMLSYRSLTTRDKMKGEIMRVR